MPGTSFDRVAHEYDETRGGLRRGGQLARVIDEWLVGDVIVELGVGTGAVALPLHERGYAIVGFDLSREMLAVAAQRLPGRVVQADAEHAPLATSSVDSAVASWVLHLIASPIAALREVARFLRPGGRLVAITTSQPHPDDEIERALAPVFALRRPGRSDDELLAATPDELAVLHVGHTPWHEFPSSPAETIAALERRTWSTLFDLDDEAFERIVRPVIDELRAMPDPDRSRTRQNRHGLLVWERRDLAS